jgi:hypothetical protein
MRAGEYGEFAFRTWSELPQFVIAGVNLVGGEDFVDGAHGEILT